MLQTQTQGRQTKNLPELPSSYDREYFDESGDVRRVNKTHLRNSVCEDCEWRLLADKREVQCERCGRGFKFSVSQVEEFPDRLEIKTLSDPIILKLKT